MVDVEVVIGDLCRAATDGICTSTNPHLALMIGTGGAVRDAGGWQIQEACAQLVAEEHARSRRRYFPVGSAHLTTAGALPFRGVIHCVASDVFHATSEDTIASCVRNALRIADDESWTSLAIPLFGTGHAAFQEERAMEAMAGVLATITTRSVQRVVIVVRTDGQVAAMTRALARR